MHRFSFLALIGAVPFCVTGFAVEPASANSATAVSCSYTLHNNSRHTLQTLWVQASKPVGGPFRVTLKSNPSIDEAGPLRGSGGTTGAIYLGHGSMPPVVTSSQITVTINAGKIICAYDAAGSNP